MKKNLYMVSLPYSLEVNEEQFNILNKYFKISYRDENYFELSNYDKEFKELDKEGREKYKQDKYKEYLNKANKDVRIDERQAVVDLLLCVEECDFVQLEILKKIPVEVEPKINNFSELAERFEKAISKIPEEPFNNLCNVHIGGSLLMTVNDLKLLVDACTDEVQKELNEGWRIVSCCVQPDGRRPDYILGRYDPDKDIKIDNAKRRH